MELERLNHLNTELLRRVTGIPLHDFEEELRKWDGKPPSTHEIADFFIEREKLAMGSDFEVHSHIWRDIRMKLKVSYLERLVKSGKVVTADYHEHREPWKKPGPVPKSVYIHSERIPARKKAMI